MFCAMRCRWLSDKQKTSGRIRFVNHRWCVWTKGASTRLCHAVMERASWCLCDHALLEMYDSLSHVDCICFRQHTASSTVVSTFHFVLPAGTMAHSPEAKWLQNAPRLMYYIFVCTKCTCVWDTRAKRCETWNSCMKILYIYFGKFACVTRFALPRNTSSRRKCDALGIASTSTASDTHFIRWWCSFCT